MNEEKKANRESDLPLSPSDADIERENIFNTLNTIDTIQIYASEECKRVIQLHHRIINVLEDYHREYRPKHPTTSEDQQLSTVFDSCLGITREASEHLEAEKLERIWRLAFRAIERVTKQMGAGWTDEKELARRYKETAEASGGTD